LSIIYLEVLGFSRIYLGAHSHNQVLFGFTIGLYLAWVMHFYIRKFYLEIKVENGKYLISFREVVKYFVLTFLIPINMLLLTKLINTRYHEKNEDEAIWMANIAKICPKD
jgi:ACR3 family arsenite efflux pump ArsB